MGLYRCAACGSPNVVTDTQANGLKYNYLKGSIGTVVLGAGGAAAGVNSQQQTVYKCPDCGITLTYPMDLELAKLIDFGVRYPDLRTQLSYQGTPLLWDAFILQKFKNVAPDKSMDDLKEVVEENPWEAKQRAQKEEIITKEKEYVDDITDTILGKKESIQKSLTSGIMVEASAIPSTSLWSKKKEEYLLNARESNNPTLKQNSQLAYESMLITELARQPLSDRQYVTLLQLIDQNDAAHENRIKAVMRVFLCNAGLLNYKRDSKAQCNIYSINDDAINP